MRTWGVHNNLVRFARYFVSLCVLFYVFQAIMAVCFLVSLVPNYMWCTYVCKNKYVAVAPHTGSVD